MQTLLLLSVLTAGSALEDLDAMCRADAQRLWGRTLCGPTLLVDPATREALASVDGKVTTVHLPESIGIANTAVEWDGKRWTMVMLPLPKDPFAMRALLAHESFHRIQQDLGFPATGPSNAHLDTADGRYWLRLEWRALAHALDPRTSRREAKRAIEDALAFRAKRRALAKSAADEERQLEMHEGLAQHTGVALAEPRMKERAKQIRRLLAEAEKGESFVRSFAYGSGPAWGAVIEQRDPRWTRTLKASDDLGELARRAWDIRETREPRLAAYDATSLLTEEEQRARRKQEERAALLARYVDGPRLALPLGQMQLVFDPNGVQPLGEHGTVYRTIEISDAWGKIVVTEGAMISADWKWLIVPAGEGKLELREGWTKVPGKRAGDITVDKR